MSNASNLKRYTFHTRALIISSVVLAYTIGFFFIYSYLQNGIVSSLSILPAVTIGWLCGKSIGFAGGVALSIWNTFLFALLGEPPLESTLAGPGIMGSLLLLIAGTGVGWLSEMLQTLQIQTIRLAEEVEERKRIEESLRTSEAHNQAVLAAFPDMIFTISHTGKVLTYHVHNEDQLLVPASEFLGSQIDDVVPASLARRLHVHIEKAITTGAVQALEFQFPAPSGPQHFEARLTCIDNNNVLIVVRNTTQKIRAQQQQAMLETQTQHVKALSELINNFSHDFKTPLSIINTNTYLLKRESLSPSAQHRVHGIQEQSRRIENDVHAILTLSKLSAAGQLPLHTLNLNQVVTPLQVKYEDMATHHKVNLNIQLDEPHILVSAHESTLAQALHRLVENAISYNKVGGRVTIHAYIEGGHAVVEISDTGIGIDPADHERIFEPFFRVDPARSIQTGGVGIGLSIASKSVQLHGGHIEVKSQPGQGSVFRVYLQLAEQPKPSKGGSGNFLPTDSLAEV